MATRKPVPPAAPTAATPRTNYNAAYSVLFRHRQMVHELLRFVLPRSVHEAIDPAGTFRRLPTIYHTEALAERDGDTAYELAFLAPRSPLLLLTEFQSTAQAWMSLRMLTYTALAWEQWVRDAEETPQFVPPTLGMVLYNGAEPWREEAHKEMRPGVTLHGITSRIELNARRAVSALQPEGWYYLVDIERLQGLERSDNLAALLFRLERCKTVDHLVPVVDVLARRLGEQSDSDLDKAFAAFILEVLRSRGLHIPRTQLNSLLGVKTMLEGHEQWKKELVDKGAQQGLQQGMIAGRLGRLLTPQETERLIAYLTVHPMTIEQLAQASPEDVAKWIAPAGAKMGTNGRGKR